MHPRINLKNKLKTSRLTLAENSEAVKHLLLKSLRPSVGGNTLGIFPALG